MSDQTVLLALLVGGMMLGIVGAFLRIPGPQALGLTFIPFVGVGFAVVFC